MTIMVIAKAGLVSISGAVTRLRGLVDVDHEGHAGDQHRDTPEDGHVGEEHGHRAGEQANQREADHVDARALGMLVRQVLGQEIGMKNTAMMPIPKRMRQSTRVM